MHYGIRICATFEVLANAYGRRIMQNECTYEWSNEQSAGHVYHTRLYMFTTHAFTMHTHVRAHMHLCAPTYTGNTFYSKRIHSIVREHVL